MGGFDEQGDFSGRFDYTMPTVYRPAWREDIDACRKVFLDELRSKRIRARLVGQGGEDEENFSHGRVS